MISDYMMHATLNTSVNLEMLQSFSEEYGLWRFFLIKIVMRKFSAFYLLIMFKIFKGSKKSQNTEYSPKENMLYKKDPIKRLLVVKSHKGICNIALRDISE